MPADPVPSADEERREIDFHDPLADDFPSSLEGRFLFWIAVVFSAFQIATAAHLIDFPSQVIRAFHVGFLLLLAFPLVALSKRGGIGLKVLAWGMAALAVFVALYQWEQYNDLILRAGDPLPRGAARQDLGHRA